MGKSVLFLVLSFISINVSAGSGADFLKIDVDARTVSMGSAYTAVSNGINSINYNPAGLSGLKNVELGLSHTSWIMDSKIDFAGIAVPVKKNGINLGFGFKRFSDGDIQSRNDDGTLTGSYSAYSQVITLSGAKEMKKTGLGMGLKYLQSGIETENSSSFAVDFGITRKLNNLPASLGLSVQNLGKKTGYMGQEDNLPLTVSVGGLVNVMSAFSIAADVKRLIYDKKTSISLGTEYTIFSGVSPLSLRTGYMSENGLISSKTKGFSFGAGLNILNTQVDYSVTPYNELGNTQNITLKRKF